jgi:1-acyl-sn-glycerol-3-phosphate acyltransferase
MPPRLVRRVLIAPLVVVAGTALIAGLPLLLLVAAGLSPWIPGRWRPLRLLLFAVGYLVVEIAGLLAAYVVWVWSGFGVHQRSPAFVARNHAILRGALRALVALATRAFNVSFEVENPPAPGTRGPRIVMSRHAGPGDSFLIVHRVYRRGLHPRIVLKDLLQWEPLIDVILNRVPSTFVGHRPQDRGAAVPAVRELARTMGERDALVIFPEGGNFTAARRRHSITRLEELGRHEEAEQARAMRNVLAPRPGGVLAALEACPQAGVDVVAHTGLEDLSTPVDLWRGLPMDAAVDIRLWSFEAGELPAEAAGRERWLYARWAEMDDWIAARRLARGEPGEPLAELRAGG